VQPQADQVQPVVRTLAGLVIGRVLTSGLACAMALGEAGDGLGECALVIVECDRHRASWVLWGTGSTH
jgi:hypothetical protein